MLALCRKFILWPPEADDVVVHLAITGNLDQHDRALAPVPQRLYPQTGPFLVHRFEVLVVQEVALTLHQAVAARAGVAKGTDLQGLRVVKSAPDTLALAAHDGKAVRIVDGAAIVVEAHPVVRIEQKHAGHRRK